MYLQTWAILTCIYCSESHAADDVVWDPAKGEFIVPGPCLREVPINKVSNKVDRKREMNEFNFEDVKDGDDLLKVKNIPVKCLAPPEGELKIWDLKVGDDVFVCSEPTKADGKWILSTIYEVTEAMDQKIYKTSSNDAFTPNKTVFGEMVVMARPQPARLQIKQRVVTYYRRSPVEHGSKSKHPEAGFVAELPNSNNNFQYLIFFDSGQACYAPHDEIYAHFKYEFYTVLAKIRDWSKRYAEFLAKYFTAYPERSMITRLVPEGDIRVLQTVDNSSKWYPGKVKITRWSLVQIRIKKLRTTKWFFRGSLFLKPIFDQFWPNESYETPYEPLAASTSEAGVPTSAADRDYNPRPLKKISLIQPRARKTLVLQRRTANTVVQVQKDASADSASTSNSEDETFRIGRDRKKKREKKKPAPRARSDPKIEEMKEDPKRRLFQKKNVEYPEHYLSKYIMAPRVKYDEVFIRHNSCNSNCLKVPIHDEYTPEEFRDMNPFVVPIILGWRREIRKMNDTTMAHVCYRAPCGRTVWSVQQAFNLLSTMKSNMPIDLFVFDTKIELLTDKETIGCYYKTEDLSDGLEAKPVSVVNEFEAVPPSEFTYSTKSSFSDAIRESNVAHKEVNGKAVFDTDFRSCCSCKDDCSNVLKCECQRLTMDMGKICHPNEKKYESGYSWKMLTDNIFTGIYECNSSCKCSHKCLNRVVQLGLKHRLQLFKTAKKGWGVRALDDIPSGSFVCHYAAKILTPLEGEDDSKADIYFADLDLLQRLEFSKADLYNIPEDFVSSGEEEDDESNQGYSEYADDGVQLMPSWKPKKDKPNKGATDLEQMSILRHFFTQNDIDMRRIPYVMDANYEGNIGRYFNHSCAPNCFVQNVFVETHDPRFPVICLFTSKRVKAFQELTWDYGYVVDSVPGRELACHCGAKTCRKRLL